MEPSWTESILGGSCRIDSANLTFKSYVSKVYVIVQWFYTQQGWSSLSIIGSLIVLSAIDNAVEVESTTSHNDIS